MNRAALPCALATLFIADAALATEAPANLVIEGGSVWSVDPASSRAKAVAVSGRISFVGSAQDAKALGESSIEAGKLADLAVIDRDILERPAGELLEARVLFTQLGGKVVYSAEAGP